MGKSKIITYVVVALLVLAGLYWAYGMINKSPQEPTGGVTPVSSAGITGTTENSQASQFVDILNDVDDIDLQNRLILNNKIFTSLRDFGRTIEDRVVGRTDPFAPLLEGGTGIIKKDATTENIITEPDLTE